MKKFFKLFFFFNFNIFYYIDNISLNCNMKLKLNIWYNNWQITFDYNKYIFLCSIENLDICLAYSIKLLWNHFYCWMLHIIMLKGSMILKFPHHDFYVKTL